MGRHERNPKRVYIFDTTLRDGEQATDGAIYGIESKLIIASALAEAGFDRIEVGFPTSSDKDFEAVQKIARSVQGPVIFGLTRSILDDVSRTYEALRDAQYPGLHVCSIMFDEKGIAGFKTSKDRVIEDGVRSVGRARNLIGPNGQVEFSFQTATTAPLEWLIEGYTKVVNAGANVINIPDTVGYSEPEEIVHIVNELRKVIPEYVMISVHCHDDLGKSVANSLAALKAGADIVEGTINGIGERAGNAAIEEIIMNIKMRPDVYKGRYTSVDTTRLNELSQLVSEHFNLAVQDNKAIVGRNAFIHKSGMHQDGMEKGDLYEIMRPEDVGWEGEGFQLTARSGYKGVGKRIRKLGYNADNAYVKDNIMPSFKRLADIKRKIEDVDLVVLMDNARGIEPRITYRDHSVQKVAGSGDYNATVTLEMNGSVISSIRTDSNGRGKSIKDVVAQEHGAIAALYSAVESVVGIPKGWNLVYFGPQNIGFGNDAMAETTIILSKREKFDGIIRPFAGDIVVGRGYDKDTLSASVKAYVDALNKIR